jgi:ectoine hydroxylase-related dioxygenase (phytanoyl-CoA dioxygenase family)
MEWKPRPDEWRQRYAEDGYLVVENVVDAGLLGSMREALERIELAVAENTLPPRLRGMISLESDRTRGLRGDAVESNAISNIMELPLFDPIFRDLIVYPRALDVLEALFESTEFAFHNYKCICKMPGGQAHFQWHRDLPYLEHTTPNLITCMLCIDAMTEENGATVVCPGTHRIPHELVKPGDMDIPESEVPAERTAVTCPAGSAVLFHVSLLHGGPPNRTDTKRRNVIGIWSGPDAFPTNPNRYVYQAVMPRSIEPMRQKQIAMTFGPQ